MSTRMRDAMMSGLSGLRHEPTAKRIRASLGGTTIIDSTRAVLLWEPRHLMPDLAERPVLDPSIPFAVHTAGGEPLDISADGQQRHGAAFRLDDPQLPGYVVLDFAAFDQWLEEDEPTVAHPRDPFHRIDVLAGSRTVRVHLDGETLAESSRPTLLFETMLPTRFYLPRGDVHAELVPSAHRSFCAYKGEASYLSPVVGGRPVTDLAWTYPAPLHDAAPVRDLVCFFDERVDVELDGVPQARPLTPWSPRR